MGLGLSKRRFFFANSSLPLPFDLFVDSVAGNDSNSGTSVSSPLKTLAAALSKAFTGVRIGLANGSFWRETFDLSTVSHPVVTNYGSGSPPRISGADIISSWTKTAGKTNVYQASISQNSNSTNRLTVYEDGLLLTRVADATTCDSTAGSFVKVVGSAGTPVTIQIHTSDNSDPNSNGKTYEVTTRHSVLTGTDNSAVAGIQTEKQISNNGSTDFVNRQNVSVTRILAANGTKHNLGFGTGTVEDCIAYLADAVTAEEPGNTSFIGFVNDGSGKSFTVSRCGTIGLCPGVDWDAHGSPIGYDSTNAIQIWAINTNNFVGSWTTNTGSFYKGVVGFPCSLGTIKKSMGDIVSTHTPSGLGQYGTTLMQDCTVIKRQSTTYDEVFRSQSGISTLSQCSLYCDTLTTGHATVWWNNSSSSAVLTVNNSIIFNGFYLMQLTAGETYVGNYNVFFAAIPGDSSTHIHFYYQGTNIYSLSGWQTATGQDAQSVYLARADQTASNQYAFWLGVSTGANNGPKDNDWRINPNARVYSGADVAYIGTFPDGTLITTAGTQSHWDWNARNSASGPPTLAPNVPASLSDAQTYINSPTSWIF